MHSRREDGPKAETLARQPSLTLLRRRLMMEAEADAVVAVGGLKPRGDLILGVDEELELARENRIPCFLVGGLGGQTETLSNTNLEKFSSGNELSKAQRDELARSEDVASLAGSIVGHLVAAKPRLLAPARPFDAALFYERFLSLDINEQRREFAIIGKHDLGKLVRATDSQIFGTLSSEQPTSPKEVDRLVWRAYHDDVVDGWEGDQTKGGATSTPLQLIGGGSALLE